MASSEGKGYSPVSFFCFTQSLVVMAHVLKVWTALDT